MAETACAHCGARFIAHRSTAKFCSDRCRVNAHRGGARPMGATWLRKAAMELASTVFAPAGVRTDAKSFDVSFGYPIKMQRVGFVKGQKRYVGGAAFGTTAIVIPPNPDAVRVLDILAHEMIHIICPGCGHKSEFQRVADAVGLRPPYTATTASPELVEKLRLIVLKLGPMPLPFDALLGVEPGWIERPDGSFVPNVMEKPWLPTRRLKKKIA